MPALSSPHQTIIEPPKGWRQIDWSELREYRDLFYLLVRRGILRSLCPPNSFASDVEAFGGTLEEALRDGAGCDRLEEELADRGMKNYRCEGATKDPLAAICAIGH